MNMQELIKKYNKPIPRYTSYPTVPFWHNTPNELEWKEHVSKQFNISNPSEGISLYIHLPFCESLCTYCGCNTRITVNHAVEIPYIEALEKEFLLYLSLFNEKPRIAELHLGGGTPTFFKPENLERLISFIFKHSIITDKASLSFEAHPNNTNKEHLRVLANLGFKRLSLGIQDFDPHVQELINRHQSMEEVENVTTLARSLGYNSINFDLIYGLPDQNLESIRTTIKEVIKLMPERIAFYSYAHVPWLKPGQRKYNESNLPSGEEKYALYQLGREMLEQAGYIEIGMDHFALEGDSLLSAMNRSILHRNFMGYTDNHTHLLLALGVSSISDSWTCFAQNEKKLEDYYRRIDNNEIPIMKGHQLSDDDLKRRVLILEMMCKLKTKFVPSLLNSSAISLLNELLADQLITIINDTIEVSYTGRALLRNCCSVYDGYISDELKNVNTFSMSI
jgi:oxygen-independent coproporphyrinogen III oxidase